MKKDKMWKYVVGILVLIVVVGCLFILMSDDAGSGLDEGGVFDDSEVSGGSISGFEDYDQLSPEKLIGLWQVVYEEEGDEKNEDIEGYSVEFEMDGSYIISNFFVSGSGDYDVLADMVVLKDFRGYEYEGYWGVKENKLRLEFPDIPLVSVYEKTE